MEKEEINFGSSVDELLKGLEGFVSSKTVVGEPIQVNDATIIPLVDMKFGMGAGAFKKIVTIRRQEELELILAHVPC